MKVFKIESLNLQTKLNRNSTYLISYGEILSVQDNEVSILFHVEVNGHLTYKHEKTLKYIITSFYYSNFFLTLKSLDIIESKNDFFTSTFDIHCGQVGVDVYVVSRGSRKSRQSRVVPWEDFSISGVRGHILHILVIVPIQRSWSFSRTWAI